jgi:3'-phosphoadenosine 5'-phosphosulfate sulfotransferase (PAPS reductase)/FAD synthetase
MKMIPSTRKRLWKETMRMKTEITGHKLKKPGLALVLEEELKDQELE